MNAESGIMVIAYPNINLLAVVVVAIVSFIIGAVWYAPPVFGNMWMKLLGKKREELGSPGPAFVGGFIGALIFAYVLALLMGYAQAKALIDGVVIGLLAWIGFVITTSAPEVLFAKTPIRLYLINNIHHLVVFLIAGAILGVWT